MTATSLIVVGSDGRVLAATGDLPSGLVDVRLEDCQSLPQLVREAGRILLDRLRAERTRTLSRTLALDGQERVLQLVAVDALAIRRAPVDLRRLLKSKLAVLSSQATTAGITLGIEVADDVPAQVFLDAEKVAWAITTLVGNALRYAQTGSRDLRGRAIAVTAAYDVSASEVAIDVRDDGPGVSEDTVSRLFKRDTLNVQGAGLALLLISDIMSAHSGRIDVQSRYRIALHTVRGSDWCFQ